MKEENCRFLKLMLVLIFIVVLAIFVKQIINPHYETIQKEEILKLKAHDVFGDYFNIERYTGLLEYVCTESVIINDVGNKVFFKVNGKGAKGTCILIYEKEVFKII